MLKSPTERIILSLLVAPVTIVSSTEQPTSAYTITLTLPEINYPHSELIIMSTLTPTDSAPITDDYPLSSQYSITFNGLSVGVVYSYSIRIVLRRNTSIDVSIPLTGSFQLSKHCITVTVFDYETLVHMAYLFVLLLPTTLSRCLQYTILMNNSLVLVQ